jgi:hypothetical protein
VHLGGATQLWATTQRDAKVPTRQWPTAGDETSSGSDEQSGATSTRGALKRKVDVVADDAHGTVMLTRRTVTNNNAYVLFVGAISSIY